MLNLHVIAASARPGRGGWSVAQWFHGVAEADKRFSTTLVDLAAIGLPMLDEPNHPRLRQYLHDHTKRWSSLVEAADAYVFVTPEYNYSFPASLKNAIDYLHGEWMDKPVGFVSYGGVSGGLRCVQHLKNVTGALSMVALNEAVVIPFYAQQRDEDGHFTANPIQVDAAGAMLDALDRMGLALKRLRTEK